MKRVGENERDLDVMLSLVEADDQGILKRRF
jgi:hypothetical protein